MKGEEDEIVLKSFFPLILIIALVSPALANSGQVDNGKNPAGQGLRNITMAQNSDPANFQVPGIPGANSLPKPGQPGMAGVDSGAVENDIRDIKGPLPVADPMLPLWIALGAVLALLACYLIYKGIIRMRKIRQMEAHEIALEKLEKAKIFIKESKPKEYSLAVTGAVRPYIEQRFNLRATRSTTEEFFRELETCPEEELLQYKEVLAGFLTNCDLAKFARYGLDKEQMMEMHHNAWVFIDKTKIQENNNGNGR